MMRRDPTIARLAVALALLAFAALPCRGASRFLEDVDDFDILRLESNQPVQTWVEDGVRVFVAQQGAVIRQGNARLSARRMVVWFDVERSSRPDVRAALVMVYAEGVVSGRGRLVGPVRLVEDGEVRRFGAVYMQWISTFSFVWDCPLERSQAPVESLLMVRALALTAGEPGERVWDAYPAVDVPALPGEVVTRFAARESQAFTDIEAETITFVYMGDVHGTFENMEIEADSAVLWLDIERDVQEVYARGDVRLFRSPRFPRPERREPREAGEVELNDVLEFIAADELFINPTENRGMMIHPEVRILDPERAEDIVWVARGDQAFLLDAKTMTIQEATITTSQFAHPSWQVRADRVQIVRERPSTLLNAWDVRMQAGRGETTLLWVPFLSMDMTRRAFLLRDLNLGSSQGTGFSVQTTWAPLDLTRRPPEWIDDWIVMLDYFGARGPGIGTEFEYEYPVEGGYPRHEGLVRAYIMSDTAERDDTERRVPEETRGRVHVQHRTRLNPDWRGDAEFYWLSDRGFLNEFLETSLEEEKTPETYLLARYLRDSAYLAVLYKFRVNEFLTVLEEKPSATLEVVGLPVGPFVYEGMIEAGNFDLQLSDELTPMPVDPPAVTRVHTDHTIQAPFNLQGVRVSPFLRFLATWASESTGLGTNPESTASRSGTGLGVMASTTFSRAFGLVSERFDLNRLRHIVRPYVLVETLGVSDTSSDFIQMDRIDAIDSGSRVVLGLRQRMQTKRRRDEQDGWRSVDWVELDVAYVGRASDSVARILDEDIIRADLNWLLSRHVSIHSRDNRFGLEGQNSLFNIGATVDHLPAWLLNVDYNFISDTSSTLTAELSYLLSDRYRLLLFEQYDFDSRGRGDTTSLETLVVIRRILDQWVLDLGLHIEKANDEFAIVFGFGPRGYGAYEDTRRVGRR